MATIIIGAGVIGVATAYALHRAGEEEVVVLDRQPGPGQETSRANASLLHPSLVEPWNSPGIPRVLLRSLGREEAAVLVRLHALPSLLGWGLRFLRESAPRRYLHNTLRNLRLARCSVEAMQALREDTGIRFHHYRRGSLTLYRDAASFAGAQRWYAGLAPHGLETRVLDPASLADLDPALAPVAHRLSGGIHAPIDEGGDPFAFCAALHAWLAQHGVRFRFETPVMRIVAGRERVLGVDLAGGEHLAADRVVLACASDSPLLARGVGVRLPVRPVKGYSMTLPRNTSAAPRMPVTDAFLHLAVVPVGEDRVRVAGTAEFAGYDRRVTPARVRNLWRLLGQLYPAYVQALGDVERNAWAGLRPMCPDGVPLIGPTRLPGLLVNTGHGHVGWTLAAGSARLLADLALGRPPPLAAADYAPGRFAGA